MHMTTQKVALCFIINYDHVLTKEDLWREWIEPNQDILNVYFFYQDLRKIKSPWILKHTLPPSFIHHTSYYHVMPAYLSLLKFALNHDPQNKWFCMLTDSCCPIVSPTRFRYMFFQHGHQSIMTCKPAWWNPYFHHRANLAKLPKEWWLGNDPWFTLTREHALQAVDFTIRQPKLVSLVCSGGLANESYFAMAMKNFNQLQSPNRINVSTHLIDWRRPSSATSPHVFKDGDAKDVAFLERGLRTHHYAMFVRKVAPEFPDNVLRHCIYDLHKERDQSLKWEEKKPEYVSMGFIEGHALILGMGCVCFWGFLLLVNYFAHI